MAHASAVEWKGDDVKPKKSHDVMSQTVLHMVFNSANTDRDRNTHTHTEKDTRATCEIWFDLK